MVMYLAKPTKTYMLNVDFNMYVVIRSVRRNVSLVVNTDAVPSVRTTSHNNAVS